MQQARELMHTEIDKFFSEMSPYRKSWREFYKDINLAPYTPDELNQIMHDELLEEGVSEIPEIPDILRSYLTEVSRVIFKRSYPHEFTGEVYNIAIWDDYYTAQTYNVVDVGDGGCADRDVLVLDGLYKGKVFHYNCEGTAYQRCDIGDYLTKKINFMYDD